MSINSSKLPVNSQRLSNSSLENLTTLDLVKLTADIRLDVLEMLYLAKSGHPASSFDTLEILVTLYFKVMNIMPNRPKWKERDFLILSNGHASPALYATLSKRGYFPKKKLWSLREIGSELQGHPSKNLNLGIEASTGSLGQGISQAVGLAVTLKRDGKGNKVYVIVGDGELEEGSFWEALLFASKEKLNNLYIIIDNNNIQIDGKVEEISSLNSLNKKLIGFNCRTIEIDGNNIQQVLMAFQHLQNLNLSQRNNRLNVIIAKTTAGFGIPFIENNADWHGRVFNEEEYLKAKRVLKKSISRLNEE